MTAEVAIMNTKGIALAADSAVTLGAGGGKVYNTMDKLFALSKYHPVGIMIYSTTSILGIEWEVIIKNYRDHLGKKSFDKLSDYAKDFINFLTSFPYFTDDQMIVYLISMCRLVSSRILRWFLDNLHIEFDGKENIELGQIDAVFNKSLEEIKEKIKKLEDEKAIKVDFEFIDSNSEAINEVLKNVFEDYKLSKKQIAEIIDIIKLVFQKDVNWIDYYYTGIVIAGYGEREIFPVCCHFKVSGKLGDSLICSGRETFQIDIDTGDTAWIIPFAQTEMVHQFARGITPEFNDAIVEKIDAILNALLPLIKDFNKEKTDSLSKLLTEYMNQFSDIVYKDPVMNIVASMEKSELTSMAEAMVNLTALKRHVSTDEETVGPPIDVALITKGDGFIWINKKTNYDPHLNRNLRQKYFRGDINENL
jgi:hypothetical protein